VSESGLFRVLDVDDERLLLVSVDDPTASATDDGTSDDATDDPPPDPAGPTPGVPDVGDSPTEGDTTTPDASTGSAADRSYDPVSVPLEGHGEVDATLAALLPGYLVEARLSWTDPEPRVERVAVRKRTLFAFADDVVNLFEAAEATWREAAARGEAMGSRVTRGTDGRPNGVLYAFADPDGADRLAEFRTGRRPLEPLLARVNATAPGADDPGAAWRDDEPSVSVGPGGITVTDERRDPPEHGLGHDREVFVLRPAGGQFVVVLIALRKGGTLANTVRETYHCPRPDEE